MTRNFSFRALVGWSVLAALLLPFAGRIDRQLRATSPVAGSESDSVVRTIAGQFATETAETALLVMTGFAQPVTEESGRAEVRRVLEPLRSHGEVGRVLSPATLLDTLLIGHDAHSAIALVGVKSSDPTVIVALRTLTDSIVTAERTRNKQFDMEWTGQSALIADLRTVSVSAVHRAELLALPATAVVAFLAFGSLQSVLIALVAAGLVVAIATGASGALSAFVTPTVLSKPVISLLGFALTLDYVLLLMRWPGDARQATPRRTVRIAGIVVALGFAGLVAAPTGELRSAALSGMLVALLASTVATTLIWQSDTSAPTKSSSPTHETPSIFRANLDAHNKRWRRWGEFVTHHPWRVLILSVLPLLALAAQIVGARFATPITGWLPESAEAMHALSTLERMQRGGLAGTSRVLLTLPEGTNVLSPRGWNALREVGNAIRQMPGVGDARSLATIGTGELLVAEHVLPASVVQNYVARNAHQTVLDIIPLPTTGAAGGVEIVQALRLLDIARITGVPGARLQVGGFPAYVLDYESGLRRALPWIVSATALASFIAILIMLRAPVVALKAVVLNLFVAAAALGATVLVFQRGFGVSLLGHEALGSIFPTVPVLAFGASFGISMDYELFLLGGVRAARAQGALPRESVVEGLVSVGGVITRAAMVMMAVFFAFAFSSLLPLAMVGFTLAVVVLLDATLVRLALAPATLALAGRWNWWPGALFK